MEGLKYMIAVTVRSAREKYLEFFKTHGIHRVLTKFCEGTATDSVLDIMGLEATENVMFECMVRSDMLGQLKKGLVYDMDIESPGNGVAMFIPVDAVAGETALKYMAGSEPVERKERDKMQENSNQLALVVTIADSGNTSTIMDAARSAGASGGTVVKAKGTGAEIAKFFGVAICEDKEMVYIVCKRERRDDIMKAIMSKAGVGTDCHGVTFSLPVDSVLGIKALEEF